LVLLGQIRRTARSRAAEERATVQATP